MHTRFVALVAALAACGGSSTPGGTPGQSSSCTVTLSGAVSGTFDCKPATTAWSSSNNQGGFVFNVGSGSGTPTAPAINVAIGVTGEPHTGTYRSSDSGVSGGLTAQTGNTTIWFA